MSKRLLDTSYKKICNTVINKFDTFHEVIFYKNSFEVKYKGDGTIDLETGELLDVKKNVDRSRKFVEKNGVLEPLADTVTIENLQKTINNSCKRAKDNFYGYALSNEWQYFCTFTVNQEMYGQSDDTVKYAWRIFLQKLKRKVGNQVKVLAVPERHEKSKVIHFHALVGDCNLDPYLQIAINPYTQQPIKTRYGHQIYNISLWGYGYNTVVKIDTKDNYLKVTNYLIGYTTKSNNIGYNKKKFYHTLNLNFKDKLVTYLDEEGQKELVNSLFTVLYKETDRMIVYRVYDIKKES